MNTKELRDLDQAALKKELLELLKTQFNLRIMLKTNQLRNTSALRKTRRDIARVRTILTQKASTK